MFIAMNRFRVAKGSEAAFEHVWLSRDGHLDEVPGFTACSPDHPVPITSHAPASYSPYPRLKTTIPRLTPSIPSSRQTPHIPARAAAVA
jgi:hypothetical protein